ncbi:hypothetical protein BH11GEM1_BH11GEM1_12350 [soil metagenome]
MSHTGSFYGCDMRRATSSLSLAAMVSDSTMALMLFPFWPARRGTALRAVDQVA